MKRKEMEITTIIGKDAVCDGDFTSEGSVRLDGCVNGNVSVKGTFIVGAAGSVNGNIDASMAVIGGEIMGNITTSVKVELTSTARVIGDITTSGIVIDEKAIFQGRCDMNQDASSKRPKPAGRALRAGQKDAQAAISEAMRYTDDENQEDEED